MRHNWHLRLLLIVGLCAGPAIVTGQDPAPQPAPGGYTTTLSTEVGVRFLGTSGNFSKYRSDLNYGRGFRVFDFDLVSRNDNNQGGLFDTLRVNSRGWSGEPSQSVRVEAEKTKWYRFNANFRRVDYFNALTNLALGQHTSDTRRKFGDFALTLRPQSEHLRFNLGYSVDSAAGPSLSTFDYSRDEFQVEAPVRNIAHDFRFGIDAKVWGVDLSFLQGYRRFKDDGIYFISAFTPGNSLTNQTVLATYRREMPTRGSLPFTRFSLHKLINERVDFTGRFIYTTATTRYTLSETLTGKDFSGNNVTLDQYDATGRAKKPQALGDVGLTFYATDRLTLSNTFRVNSFRIDGNNRLREQLLRTRTTATGTTPLPPVFVDTLSLRLTNLRQFSNTIEADYKFDLKFSAHAGYRYTARRIELQHLDVPTSSFPATPTGEIEKQHTNVGFVGFKAKPLSFWTIYFDFEGGTANNVFTRIANYDYRNFRVRTSLKPTRTLAFNGALITKDNTNPARPLEGPVQDFGVEVKSRIVSTTADWEPHARFSLSSGYTFTRVDATAAIIFFLSNQRQAGSSLYFMRDHGFFFHSRLQLLPRTTLQLGYRINDDRGQGDRVAARPTELLSSYPLRFQSPQARLSVRLTERVEWNAGWEHFNYREKFLANQNYRANLAYTSLRLRF